MDILYSKDDLEELHKMFLIALQKYNEFLLEQCMTMFIPPTNIIFIEACKRNNLKCVLYCLKYMKEYMKENDKDNNITITQDHFNAVLKRSKSFVTTDGEDIIYLLIDNGYNLTYSDFLRLTELRMQLNNFTNHNFILDDKFINMCIDINFYPNYYYTFPPQKFMLDKECKKSGNAKNIMYVLKKGINPTIENLESLCIYTYNLDTIKYVLDNYDLKLNSQCMKNLTEGCSKICGYLFEIYSNN